MPGRHGKQVKKRNRSKRQPVTEMETTLKDSIHGRTRKERAILRELIPPAVKHVTKKIGLSTSLPMFSASSSSSQLPVATPTATPPSTDPISTEKSDSAAPPKASVRAASKSKSSSRK
mmetsp:Transcript_25788/g.29882  ORF Transcript_25788/g.29882 Transcript_25788/m.29882 type:complete len:118 (+) Transcript_25788:68-421(+)|eukprot:CAMPEP_0176439214 /NCGR_PEP_ID=MMETSP0127-20121128/19801_1 /TAXON_ID=938130 /ORGANISM="Platyophrya macrostoma, Strain WH" /LENGTH=117 /DNA_ID=CAMNT_0017823423 /DNA_START=85 /DNA_END=438 /DNA_ORIENTATION=-